MCCKVQWSISKLIRYIDVCVEFIYERFKDACIGGARILRQMKQYCSSISVLGINIKS